MNIVHNIKKSILAPMCYGFIGNSVLKQKKYENFLTNFEHHERDKVKKYQIQKLKELLIYSYENIPYYRTVFNKLQIDPYNNNSIKILEKLPYLTKEVINNNLKSFNISSL